MTADDEIADILTSTRSIALVGWSPNPARPSHGVARYLVGQGYRVFAVNPGQGGAPGPDGPVFARLADIPEPVDMLDIFRRSEAVLPVVQEALEALPGLRTVWMQLGVANEEAAALARARGLRVVQDRCPAIEIPRLGLPPRRTGA